MTFLLVAGCGDSAPDLVFQPQNNAPNNTATRLQVTVETTPTRGQEALYQLSGNVRRLVTFVFTPAGQVLATQDTTVNPSQNAVVQEFLGLPAGTAVVRVLAYDANGALVGYRDTAVVLSAGTTTTVGIDSLIPGSPEDGPGFEPPAPEPQPEPQPTPDPRPEPPAPTPTPRVVSLTIESSPASVPNSSGEATLALEIPRTAQLTVRATYDNGTSSDVTAQTLFTSSNTTAVTVSEQGRVQAIAPATAVVTASLEGVQTRLNVVSFQAPPLPPAPPTPPVLTPSITGLSPAVGALAGGTSVIITGTNLTGATGVSFGSAAATSFTVNSSTQITAVAPAGTGAVRVGVTTPQGVTTDTAADDYTYVDPPTFISISPFSGPLAGGNAAVVTGTGFTGATLVKVGNQTASFVLDSDTQITVTIPASATEGYEPVTVTTAAGTSATTKFSFYEYVNPPLTLSSVSPSTVSTSGGTRVTVTGTGFVGITSIEVDGILVTTYDVDSDTQLTIAVPPHVAGVVDLTVTRASGSATLSNALTYGNPPTVLAIGPSAGQRSGGQLVILSGSGFTGATSVTFGGAPGGLSVYSDGILQVATPSSPNPTGGFVDVVVTTPFGTYTATNGFRYN